MPAHMAQNLSNFNQQQNYVSQQRQPQPFNRPIGQSVNLDAMQKQQRVNPAQQ